MDISTAFFSLAKIELHEGPNFGSSVNRYILFDDKQGFTITNEKYSLKAIANKINELLPQIKSDFRKIQPEEYTQFLRRAVVINNKIHQHNEKYASKGVVKRFFLSLLGQGKIKEIVVGKEIYKSHLAKLKKCASLTHKYNTNEKKIALLKKLTEGLNDLFNEKDFQKHCKALLTVSNLYKELDKLQELDTVKEIFEKLPTRNSIIPQNPSSISQQSSLLAEQVPPLPETSSIPAIPVAGDIPEIPVTSDIPAVPQDSQLSTKSTTVNLGKPTTLAEALKNRTNGLKKVNSAIKGRLGEKTLGLFELTPDQLLKGRNKLKKVEASSTKPKESSDELQKLLNHTVLARRPDIEDDGEDGDGSDKEWDT